MIMTQIIRPTITLVVLFTLILGLGYPLAMTGIAQLAFASRADGSPILVDGKIVESGTFAELNAASGTFAAFAQRQML